MSPITPVSNVQSTLSYSQKQKNRQEAQSKLVQYTLEYIMKHGSNKTN